MSETRGAESTRFTGERIVPELENYFFFEHVARYRFALDHLLPDARHLDVGSGDGYGSYFLSTHLRAVVGIDVSGDAVAVARTKYQKANLTYEQVDADRWSVSDDTFDSATCFEVFEHVVAPETLLQQIGNVVKPGGPVFISTPNRDVYGDNLPDPYHVKEYSLQEFTAIVERYFTVKEVFGQRNDNQLAKRLNFWMARQAMRNPGILRPLNWILSHKQKKYLEPGYFDALGPRGNYFSQEQADTADYFIIIAETR